MTGDIIVTGSRGDEPLTLARLDNLCLEFDAIDRDDMVFKIRQTDYDLFRRMVRPRTDNIIVNVRDIDEQMDTLRSYRSSYYFPAIKERLNRWSRQKPVTHRKGWYRDLPKSKRRSRKTTNR